MKLLLYKARGMRPARLHHDPLSFAFFATPSSCSAVPGFDDGGLFSEGAI